MSRGLNSVLKPSGDVTMRITALVATLMLGGMTCAYAQGGPPEDRGGGAERGSPSTQDSGSSDAGRSSQVPEKQGQEKSTPSDRGESSKARSAEKSESNSGKSEERGSKARSAEEKSDKKRTTKSEDSSSSSRQSRTDDTKDATDKSANQGDRTDASKKSAGENREQTDRKTGDTEGKDAQKTAGDKTATDNAKRVDLTGDKRTRVQAALRSKGDIKRRTGVSITIAVGTRLPRDWEFVPVPQDVVVIVPEYRGYYFAYVDDTYVICDPETYEVVAVIPADRSYAGGNSSAGSKCSSQLSLNTDERELILRSVSRGREVDFADLSVGRKVPRDVELLSFPESVVSEASELGSCRYFDAGDQIAIVDPDEDKIVLIIDKG
jgi:uncharacterized protein DUF1236